MTFQVFIKLNHRHLRVASVLYSGLRHSRLYIDCIWSLGVYDTCYRAKWATYELALRRSRMRKE